MHDFVSVAETAARAGGSQLVQWMGKFDVREKGPADFVTQADLASQKAIKDILSQAFPQHGFIGEEEPLARETQPAYCWIVDPLDGTMNYVHQMRHFCVSIALEKDGELLAGVIFDPLSGECFRAARGEGAHLDGRRLQVRSTERLEDSLVAVSFPPRMERNSRHLKDFSEIVVRCRSVRRMGSSALNLAYVAAGRFDAFLAEETKSWDVAAGVLLVQEAGGCVTGPRGDAFNLQRASVLATSTAAVNAAIAELLQ